MISFRNEGLEKFLEESQIIDLIALTNRKSTQFLIFFGIHRCRNEGEAGIFLSVGEFPKQNCRSFFRVD